MASEATAKTRAIGVTDSPRHAQTAPQGMQSHHDSVAYQRRPANAVSIVLEVEKRSEVALPHVVITQLILKVNLDSEHPHAVRGSLTNSY